MVDGLIIITDTCLVITSYPYGNAPFLSIVAVGDLVAPTMSDFLWGLENSGWLKHIKAVLDAGVFIAKAILF